METSHLGWSIQESPTFRLLIVCGRLCVPIFSDNDWVISEYRRMSLGIIFFLHSCRRIDLFNFMLHPHTI